MIDLVLFGLIPAKEKKFALNIILGFNPHISSGLLKGKRTL